MKRTETAENAIKQGASTSFDGDFYYNRNGTAICSFCGGEQSEYGGGCRFSNCPTNREEEDRD